MLQALQLHYTYKITSAIIINKELCSFKQLALTVSISFELLGIIAKFSNHVLGVGKA